MSKKAFWMAAITILIWSSAFAAIRASILGGYDPGALVLFRFLVASALFLLYFLWPGVSFTFPHRSDWLRIFVLGVLGITIYHTGITTGMVTVTAGTSSMIVGSAPFFTAIIAVIFLKERMGLFSWIGLAIGFVGILLITLGTSDASFSISTGVLYVLAATVATSIFFVFQKTLNYAYHPIVLTACFTWSGTIPLLFFLPTLLENISEVSLEAHLSAIYVGIFPAAVAYTTWAIALQLADTNKVTSMMYAEPAIAIIIAWFWLGEWPSTLSIIGGAIAITSIFLVNAAGRNHKEKELSS